MAETIRRYPTVEIALSLQDMAPLASGHERKQVGDIIDVRKVSSVVGLQEMHKYLWLRVSGLEESDFSLNVGIEGFDKRRYCIPLERLQTIAPDFNIEDALDTSTIYQPFILTDKETGLFMANGPVFDVHGLVFDKVTGEYL